MIKVNCSQRYGVRFCVPQTPSCIKNTTDRQIEDGTPIIYCWCKDIGDAGKLDTTCQGIRL